MTAMECEGDFAPRLELSAYFFASLRLCEKKSGAAARREPVVAPSFRSMFHWGCWLPDWRKDMTLAKPQRRKEKNYVLFCGLVWIRRRVSPERTLKNDHGLTLVYLRVFLCVSAPPRQILSFR